MTMNIFKVYMAGFLPQLPIKKESIKTQGYHWETIEMNLTKK